MKSEDTEALGGGLYSNANFISDFLLIVLVT